MQAAFEGGGRILVPACVAVRQAQSQQGLAQAGIAGTVQRLQRGNLVLITCDGFAGLRCRVRLRSGARFGVTDGAEQQA